MAPRLGGYDADVVMDNTSVLLRTFMCEQARKSRADTAEIREQLGVPQVCEPSVKSRVKKLQRYADDLAKNRDFQGLMRETRSLTEGKFIKIATELFSDGEVNQGRVFVLFCLAGYMACEVVVQSIVDVFNWVFNFIKRILLKAVEIVQDVLEWIMNPFGLFS